MKVGNLYYWYDFPHQSDGNIKNRYAICLGDSGILELPKQFYFLSPTGQTYLYEEGGQRASHKRFVFLKEHFPQFTSERCIADCSMPLVPPVTEDELSTYTMDDKGPLPPQALALIYQSLCESRRHPRMVLSCIHTSFNRIGITGLRQPPKT